MSGSLNQWRVQQQAQQPARQQRQQQQQQAHPERLSGVFSPVLTPFNADRSPSPDRMAKHCRWLVDRGVGLAFFGTNSEANSMALAEKRRLLDTVIDAGIPPARLMPGTGACALPDAIELTRHAVDAGCGGVLMLPPFYYKGVSDEGLFRAYASVIDSVADARLRICPYHIPPVAQVGISLPLIERLLKTYPRARRLDGLISDIPRPIPTDPDRSRPTS